VEDIVCGYECRIAQLPHANRRSVANLSVLYHDNRQPGEIVLLADGFQGLSGVSLGFRISGCAKSFRKKDEQDTADCEDNEPNEFHSVGYIFAGLVVTSSTG
jgi:hypothetical protein